MSDNLRFKKNLLETYDPVSGIMYQLRMGSVATNTTILSSVVSSMIMGASHADGEFGFEFDVYDAQGTNDAYLNYLVRYNSNQSVKTLNIVTIKDTDTNNPSVVLNASQINFDTFSTGASFGGGITDISYISSQSISTNVLSSGNVYIGFGQVNSLSTNAISTGSLTIGSMTGILGASFGSISTYNLSTGNALIGNLLNVSTIAGFSPITFIDSVYFKSTIYALSSINTNKLLASSVSVSTITTMDGALKVDSIRNDGTVTGGFLHYNTTTKEVVYNELGALGPTGPTGSTGPTGPTGSTGPAGPGFTTISNSGANRVLTSDGTSNSATANSNFTFTNNSTITVPYISSVSVSTGTIIAGSMTATNVSTTAISSGVAILGGVTALSLSTTSLSSGTTRLGTTTASAISTTSVSSLTGIFGNVTTSSMSWTSRNVIIGSGATAGTSQDNSVAIGVNTSVTNQGSHCVAIGNSAGQSNQGNYGVGIGFTAGSFNQGVAAVAIGPQSGRYSQGLRGFAMGDLAGLSTQSAGAVALGAIAGQYTQGIAAVAIGCNAGNTNQGNYAVAMGLEAASNAQGAYGVAIGYAAGAQNQGVTAFAFGPQAGRYNQGAYAIAMSDLAGFSNQGSNAIALGRFAGHVSQGSNAIAIGSNAGSNAQGANAIAIGTHAGSSSQAANSIVLNASNVALQASNAGFYVNPIRLDTTVPTGVLHYNSTTDEVVYNELLRVTAISTASISSATLSASSIGVGLITINGTTGPLLTVSGDDTGDFISKKYSGSLDRYGLGQYTTGALRLFTSGSFANASVRISKPTNDVTSGSATFTDYVTVLGSSGNVGIGTSTPTSLLEVSGVITVTKASYPAINVQTATGGTYRGSMYWDHVNNKLVFDNVGNAYPIHIQGSAAYLPAVVGINTTNPVSVLHVNGGSNNYPIANLVANDAAAKTIMSNAGDLATLWPVSYGANLRLYWRNGSTYYFNQPTGTSFFTGQHANNPLDSNIKENISSYVGLIVSSADEGYFTVRDISGVKVEITGQNAITINEALPRIKLSTVDKDKAVWGVITNCESDKYNPDGTPVLDPFDPEWGNQIRNTQVRINGVGEGAIWITNINGNLDNGDYITTSIIPGYGRKQDDDLLHNYTVAKITMSCDFQLENGGKYKCEEFEYNGAMYRKAFVGCSYHCS